MIIGILGVAGAGKDTAAGFLVGHYGFARVALADPIKRLARDVFAFTDDQLWGPSEMRNAPDKRYPRDHSYAYLGDVDSDLYECACCGDRIVDWTLEKVAGVGGCFLTPRYALQTLGTEWGRHCYSNVWIEYALRVAAKLAEGGYVYYGDTGLMGGGHGDSFPPMNVVTPDLRFKNEVDTFRKAGAKLLRIVRPGAGLAGSAGRHASEAEQESIPDELFDAVIVNNGTLDDLALKVREFVEQDGAA